MTDWPEGFTPVKPALASSVMLIRDGRDGLEVLMIKRSRMMRFAAGMLVFPGGRVDRGDGSPRLRKQLRVRRRLPADSAFRTAALRELFEETGLICARTQAGSAMPGEGMRVRLARRYRKRLHQGRIGFSRMLEQAGLLLDLDSLVPFAHWITPELSPIRFDTRFYLAAAPASQRASSDGTETLDLDWLRPRDMLKAWDEGRLRLMFPTRLNLMKLARADRVSEALRQTEQTPIVTVIPEIVGTGKRQLVLPEDAGFGMTYATHQDLDPGELRLVSDEAKAVLKL